MNVNHNVNCMKKHLLLTIAGAIALSGVLFVPTSCNKDNIPPRIIYEATCYIAGNVQEMNNRKALIYRDSTLLYDLGTNVVLMDVAIGADGLYSCGAVIGEDSHFIPAVWKGDTPVELGEGIDSALFNDIVCDKNGWACCGSIGPDNPAGVIVKNGQILYKSEEPCEFSVMDMGLSGNYYVAAKGRDGLKLLSISQSGELKSMNSIDFGYEGDLSFVTVTDICVGNNDVAVSLCYVDSAAKMHGVCWILERDCWDFGAGTMANSVSFFNGYCFTGGTIYSSDMTSGKATQWINNSPQDFSAGCEGISVVSRLKNADDLFFFQCVKADNGVQICADGELFGKVSTPDSFMVSGWDIEIHPMAGQ